MTVARVAPETTTPTSNASTPYPASAAAVPGTIEVENFDAGDAEVAYHDGSAGNSGGAYRETGVDLEPTADTSGLTERNRGTFPGPTPGLRLRIRAHPGGYRAPRTLVTVPIRQVRMPSGSHAPTPREAVERSTLLNLRMTPAERRIGGRRSDRVRILPLDWGIVRGLAYALAEAARKPRARMGTPIAPAEATAP